MVKSYTLLDPIDIEPFHEVLLQLFPHRSRCAHGCVHGGQIVAGQAGVLGEGQGHGRHDVEKGHLGERKRQYTITRYVTDLQYAKLNDSRCGRQQGWSWKAREHVRKGYLGRTGADIEDIEFD